MNTSDAQSAAPLAALLPAEPRPRPILLIHGLATRLNRCFPEIAQSTTLLIEWARATIDSLARYSRAVRAIDDPVERIRPLITECLANDAPEKRAVIEKALDELHANTEHTSAEIAPR